MDPPANVGMGDQLGGAPSGGARSATNDRLSSLFTSNSGGRTSRPASSRPDPHRPARQSMVMSRPLPVILIIAKMCFVADEQSFASSSSSAANRNSSIGSPVPFTHEFARVRIPAYASVSLVKESIIKLEPRYFALEPRQLALSIMSTVSPTSESNVTHECNLDASFDRKLLIECHENIRFRYENHLPIILVFWMANFPAPPLQLDLASIPVEEGKRSTSELTHSMAEPMNSSSSSHDPTSNALAEPKIEEIVILPPTQASSTPRAFASHTGADFSVDVIEIEGDTTKEGEELTILEGEEAEQVEEKDIISTVHRTALVELYSMSDGRTRTSSLSPSSTTQSTSKEGAEIENISKPNPTPIFSQPVASVVSTVQSKDVSGSSLNQNTTISTSPTTSGTSKEEALKMSARLAMMDSKRVTISDVLLEEQLWLKPDVLKEGWLTKKQKRTGAKQKEESRWFQLRLDHHLYYFKDDSQNAVPLGRIPLAISTIELPSDGILDSFQLYYSERNKERNLLLASDHEPTLISWIDVINRTMRDAKETYQASIAQEGYLQKKGIGLKSWNRRYFVLKEGTLCYYLTSEDAKLKPDQPRGRVPLDDCYVTVNSAISSNLSSSSATINSGSSSSNLASSSSIINTSSISGTSNNASSSISTIGGIAPSNSPNSSNSLSSISHSNLASQATQNSVISGGAGITNHIFRIHVSNETLLFMASSFSELQQWLSAINEERDAMRERAHLRDTREEGGDAIGAATRMSSAANLSRSTSAMRNTGMSPSGRDRVIRTNAALPSPSSALSSTFSAYHWHLIPVKRRNIPTVDFDLPIDDVISKHIDLEHISSHVDTPQLRLIRHHHASVRAELIKRKAKYEIYDVLLAPLTRITPSVPLPDLINVRFHFGESSVAVKCPIYASILEGTAMAIDLLIRRKIFPSHIRAHDFVVKLCGSRQYLLDMDTNFVDVVYVREQLGRGRTFVEVMLHTKSAVIGEISSSKWADLMVEQQFATLPLPILDPKLKKKASGVSKSETSNFKSSEDPGSEDDLDQLLEKLVDIHRDADEAKIPMTIGEQIRSRNNTLAPADISTKKALSRLCNLIEEPCYDVHDVRGHPFSVKIVSLKNFSYHILESVVPQEAVDNAKPESRISFFIQATLFYGNRSIGESVKTAKRLTPFFNQTLDFKIDSSQLAPEMRIGVTLYVNHASKDLPLAWINVPVSDYAGRVQRGTLDLGMWIQPKAAHPVGSCESDGSRSLLLCIEFEKTPHPMAFMDCGAIPPRFELTAPPAHRPLRAPYKSEISSFRKAQPTKASHPLLGDDSMFGMSTFNKIKEEQTKQPSIGSSRTKLGPNSPSNTHHTTSHSGSNSSTGSITVPRTGSNSSIVLGARRSPQPSLGSDTATSPNSDPSSIANNPQGSLQGHSGSVNSVSPPFSLDSSREITPSTSPIPSESSVLHEDNNSSSSAKEVLGTSVPSNLGELNSSLSSSHITMGSLPARTRKSYAVSMSPPVPIGRELSPPSNMRGGSDSSFGFSAALWSTPSSSFSSPSAPQNNSQFVSAFQSMHYANNPSVLSASKPSGDELVANSQNSQNFALSSSQQGIQNASPSSTKAPDSEKKLLLANTIWSKTVASSNLSSFARNVSPNLTTSRLVAHLQEIDRICKLDPLTPLTETQKQLLWGYRNQLVEKPETFPKLFLAPNMLNLAHREELHEMLKNAPLMAPELALQLLDHRYPDSHVRAYAVRCLVNFGDEELASYLLQLVQVLQYEALYLAPLASFLVERAILNPMLIGQGLLWHLQAELYRPETETKFGILMEAILLGLKPSLREEFVSQIDFVAKMVELNDQLQTVAPSNRTVFLRKFLANFATASPPPPLQQQNASNTSSSSSNNTSSSNLNAQTASKPAAANVSEENAQISSVAASSASQNTSSNQIGSWSSGFVKEDPKSIIGSPQTIGTNANPSNSPTSTFSDSVMRSNQLKSSANIEEAKNKAFAPQGNSQMSSQSSSALSGLPPLPPPSPTRLVLPLSSSMVVKGIIVEKCKVMDSAAFPLWLAFENEDPFAEPIFVLFKFGDDLRQDALTLQMFTIMDRLWKRDGLDMKMSLYKCLPTGPSMGMIQVVPEAETTAKIQKEAGGIMGAFKQTPLFNWLKSFNTDPTMLEDSIENFTRSCAAYCVATYVIGVGDRHNDNIMVTKSGKLFHIDFAHFLGNIIKFGVYKRERAPFVLTPEFAYVMGGEKSFGFAQFKALACNLYNLLRKHASTFISLFELMLFAGLSQLSSYDDIAYLKKSLLTGALDSDASDNFAKLIDESLSTKTTQLNFAIHIFAHPD